MEVTQEQFDRYQAASKATQEALNTSQRLLKEAEKRLLDNAELLNHSTEDIHVLLAFIKSRGLQPPKIHST